MNDKEKYFFEAFEGMSRLAPGSRESTLKALALAMSGRNNGALSILDTGCGNGIHTLLLAEVFPDAHITAIDNYLPFIEKLNIESGRRNLSDRVTGICRSMEDLEDFHDSSFDMIWSEGAIYIIGFGKGIREWKRLLKPDGVLVCSDVCWLTDSPSREIIDFWQGEYPGIDYISSREKQIAGAGYRKSSWFILPDKDCNAYYDPLQKNIDIMKSRYSKSTSAMEVVAELQHEINMYRKYGREYSYVFFTMFV